MMKESPAFTEITEPVIWIRLQAINTSHQGYQGYSIKDDDEKDGYSKKEIIFPLSALLCLEEFPSTTAVHLGRGGISFSVSGKPSDVLRMIKQAIDEHP